jgi:ankyrin repeat protein
LPDRRDRSFLFAFPTALQEAARAGHLSIVKQLLTNKAVKVNGEAPTSLQLAILNGFAAVSVFLLSVRGVDPSIKTDEDRNCLHLAAASGKPEIISALLRQPALHGQLVELDCKGLTPLHLAAEQLLSESVYAILDSGAAVNVMAGDAGGDTPLHFAARAGSARSITRMLQCPKVDVNVRNLRGETPLHFGAKRCRLQPLKALLAARGIDLNAQNENGDAPLHFMMSVKPLDGFAEFLSQPGLNLNIANANGETPIHIAAKSIHTDIILKLLEFPLLDPNICDTNGQNALHKAAKSSSPKALKNMLTRKGIDIKIQQVSLPCTLRQG